MKTAFKTLLLLAVLLLTAAPAYASGPDREVLYSLTAIPVLVALASFAMMKAPWKAVRVIGLIICLFAFPAAVLGLCLVGMPYFWLLADRIGTGWFALLLILVFGGVTFLLLRKRQKRLKREAGEE